ncbi:MAG: hypothetical protein GY862_23280, partial [Gammaproteobacteria bacterium]|nr:hypothetical protein [Gammaproteobacteria bacterium]
NDDGTWTLSGTPANSDVGDHNVTLRAHDGTVDVDQSFVITVANTNDAPTFTSTKLIAGLEDAAYSYNITAADADVGDSLTLTAPVKPAWLNLTDNGGGTGTLSGTPANSDVGANNVTLRVNDGTVDVDQSFVITVANTNDAPTFTSTKVTAGTEDAVYIYTIVVTDADGDSLTLTAPVKPAWLMNLTRNDDGTWTLSGTPANSDVGDHNVTLLASDGTVDADQSFVITVANSNDAPTFTSTAVTAGTKGVAYRYVIAAADIDAGDSLTLTAPDKPAWLMSLIGNGDGTWTLSGTPASVGANDVILRVNDGTVNTDQVFVINVTDGRVSDSNNLIHRCDLNRDGDVDFAEEREPECDLAQGADPCDFNLDNAVDAFEQKQCDNASRDCEYNGNDETDEFEKERCGSDKSGSNACDFNDDKHVDATEWEKCENDPCRLDPREPGCPLFCSANPDDSGCGALPEYCKDPDLLPECGLNYKKSKYPPLYCERLPLPRERFPECYQRDLTLNLANMTWEQLESDRNVFLAIDEEDFALIPEDKFTDMTASHIKYFHKYSLQGMTLGQFRKIPPETLGGLHAGNMGGLPPEIISEMTLDEISLLDQQEFQKMDDDEIFEYFVNFNPGFLEKKEVQRLVPSDWKSETGAIKLPPGTRMHLPEINNRDTQAAQQLHLPPVPDLQKIGILDEIKQMVEKMGAGNIILSQDADTGLLIVQVQEETKFVFLPDFDEIIQVEENTPEGILINESGFFEITTPSHRQVLLRPALKNINGSTAESSAAAGVEMHLNDEGDILAKVNDKVSDTVYYVLIPDPEVRPAPEGAPPGKVFENDDGTVLYVYEDGTALYVYEDGTAQKMVPAPYRPESLERALKELDLKFSSDSEGSGGLTDIIFQVNGKIKATYYGREFLLEPVSLVDLPGEDNLRPSVTIKKKLNEDGSFQLTYTTQLPDSQDRKRGSARRSMSQKIKVSLLQSTSVPVPVSVPVSTP